MDYLKNNVRVRFLWLLRTMIYSMARSSIASRSPYCSVGKYFVSVAGASSQLQASMFIAQESARQDSPEQSRTFLLPLQPTRFCRAGCQAQQELLPSHNADRAPGNNKL